MSVLNISLFPWRCYRTVSVDQMTRTTGFRLWLFGRWFDFTRKVEVEVSRLSANELARIRG